MDLEELARLTRIPRRSLERLEGGAFDGPPDGFARGFVRTVALAIGLDPDDTLARMLPEPAGRPRAHGPAVRRALALLVALAAAFVALLGLWRLGQVLPDPAFGGAPERPRAVRSDAVRALAVSRGLIPPGRESRARPLAPVAPTGPAPPGPPGAAPETRSQDPPAAGDGSRAPQPSPAAGAPAVSPSRPPDSG